MLERYELDVFTTLAEELHFGRTAERLGVSTARVSQTVAKLERRVGVRLFDRTSRRVRLSPVGERLYADVKPAWTQIADAVARAVEAGRGLTGTLRVAFVGAGAAQLLAGVADLFQRRHPDCAVEIREAQAWDVAAWLTDGTVDLALATLPVPHDGIVAGPVLAREAGMLAVPANHPFARRETVSIADLNRVDVLEPGPSAATMHEILTQVGLGRGVHRVGAHARRYYGRPDVVYVPFHDAPRLEWALMWRRGGDTARLRAFGLVASGMMDAG